MPALQVPQGSPNKSNSEETREVIRKPAIKKMNIELSEDSSYTAKESSAPLDTAEAKLTSEKEGELNFVSTRRKYFFVCQRLLGETA